MRPMMDRFINTTMYNRHDTDKYVENIELSNACRVFYQTRLKSADTMKLRLGEIEDAERTLRNRVPTHRKSSLECAMDHLRKEMSSLMDQDLTLMKQLLTLNESIEELKWQCRFPPGTSCSGSQMSSCEEFSDTDLFDSESDLAMEQKYHNVTVLSREGASDLSSLIKDYDTMLQFEKNVPHHSTLLNSKRDQRFESNLTVSSGSSVDSRQRSVEKEVVINGNVVKICHGDQNSFDSGIHSDEERVIIV